MEKIAVVILAAGMGKRMQSELPKVAVRTREKALIQHVLETASKSHADKIVVVVGHKRELVERAALEGADSDGYDQSKLIFAVQAQQKGTGDAVRCAEQFLTNFVGTVVVLCGDAPLLRAETLNSMVERHEKEKATITLLSFHSSEPNAYGRVIRDSSTGFVRAIREAKDCSPSELQITECNSSIYAVDSSFLWAALKELKTDNAQAEFLFTDIVAQAVKEGQHVCGIVVGDADELQGVNTPVDLSHVNTILNRRKVRSLLLSGVQLVDPNSLYVDSQVQVSAGAMIGPNVQLLGSCAIGSDVVIEGSAYLKNCTIEKGARIKFSVRAEDARIGAEAQVGPFAHLRPGTILDQDVKVGNFVETKNAHLAEGAKASHLTYLGDCSVGKNSNIGAGTITCNYDGYKKYRTTIGENVFVGSNTSLIAPVTLEDGASIGAGSTIAKTTIEKDSLAFTRPPLKVRAGWAKLQREKNKA